MKGVAVESKVKAATVGAGSASIVSNFLLYVISTCVTHGTVAPEVTGFVNLVVVATGAFWGGWYARHTPRPDLDPQ